MGVLGSSTHARGLLRASDVPDEAQKASALEVLGEMRAEAGAQLQRYRVEVGLEG